MRSARALGLWMCSLLFLQFGSPLLARIGAMGLIAGTIGVGGLAFVGTISEIRRVLQKPSLLLVALGVGVAMASAIPLSPPFQSQAASKMSGLVIPPPGISPEAIRPIQGFGSIPWAGWISTDPIQTLASGIYILIQALLIGFLVIKSALLLSQSASLQPRSSISPLWMILVYAIPCWLIWLIYFLAFYPGIFPVDPLNQWQQILSGRFDNRHPAAHTLSMALIYWLWPSPALITLIQMLALGGTIGIIARALERWQIPVFARWLMIALAALSPVNGLMSITLWKDVPYTIGMIGLFAGLLHLIRDFIEERPSARSTWLGITLSGLAIALYRHNGLPVAILVLITLMMFWKQHARNLILRTGLPLILGFAGVHTVELYVLKIPPVPPWFALQVPIHHVAALIYAGTPLTDQEASFLDQIQPLDLWREGYTCRFVDPVVNNGILNREFFNAHSREFVSLWLQLIMRNPQALVRHYLCSTDFLWRITQPSDGYVYAFEWGTPANALGLASQPLLPRLQSALWFIARETLRSEWIWLFWRPALFFYLILFAGSVLALRYGIRVAWSVLAPAVIHTLLWFPLLTAPDSRFQYPVYLLALGMVPLLLSPIASAYQGRFPSPSIPG